MLRRVPKIDSCIVGGWTVQITIKYYNFNFSILTQTYLYFVIQTTCLVVNEATGSSKKNTGITNLNYANKYTLMNRNLVLKLIELKKNSICTNHNSATYRW